MNYGGKGWKKGTQKVRERFMKGTGEKKWSVENGRKVSL